MCSTVKRYFKLLFRKQSFSQLQTLDTNLDRCLSTYQLTFYGISRMIGVGIYILTGIIIKDKVGPGTNLSFLLSGFISIFTGLCYCEFSTLIPKAGSSYTYTYLMMGELPAFIIGWTVLMNYIIALAGVAKGFSAAINSIVNGTIGNWTLKHLPLSKDSTIWDSSIDIVAVLLILLLFSFSLTGISISMNVNCVLAISQILFLTTIIIACFVYGSNQNYLDDGGYLPFGFLSVFKGAGLVIFTYAGFESLANIAEETKDPKKSIPTAMLTSLSLIVILYFLISTGLPYLVPRHQIDASSPFITAFMEKNLVLMKWVTIIGTILAIAATKFTVIYIIPRAIYAMANDGLLFRFLANINKKSKIPISALITGILFSCTLTMFIKIEILADVTTIGIIISFITVGINLLILRYLHETDTEKSLMESNVPMEMRVNSCAFLANQNIFKAVLSCFIISNILFGFSFLYIYPTFQIFGIVVCTFSLMVILLMMIILSLYEPHCFKEGFTTPLMPLAPVITIILNISIIVHFPIGTWIRYLICLSFGLILYIFHGFSNSELAEKVEEIIELIKVEKMSKKE
uniref:Slc7a-5 n=1 Tax=Schmidtea mediterranea TaxID=79327 RepID=A0A0H3YJ04_SCHMD|nr:slc7a-5 [Schmidtea mediterranea]